MCGTNHKFSLRKLPQLRDVSFPLGPQTDLSFKLLQLQVLFILVDSGIKGNGKVISFFKLKTSELPALAIYRTLDEEWDTLPKAEVSLELVQNFCDGFLKGKRPVSTRLQGRQVEFSSSLCPCYFLLNKNYLAPLDFIKSKGI